MKLVSFLVFILGCVFVILPSASSSCSACLRSGQCQPPDCFCCREEMGLPLPSSEIPQIVFFTFDDALTDKAAEFYNRLFNNSRLNPNGCPISMTMFISHTDTQYNHVTEFHRRGMEIAAHSVTHNHMNKQNFYTEARNQKRNLAKYGKFPESDIVGWRSPFLEPVGDLQPEKLKQLGYSYDATLTYSKRKLNDSAPTPFTLDFGWPYDCKVKPCPQGRHLGFWEVPVVSLLDYLHQYDCVYVDGCMNIPPNENLAFKFLMDNFNSYYEREKIPFGINMHPSWFYTDERLNAMDRFIKELVSRRDVFIVSVKKTLDWLKNPTPLSRINSFLPWQCKSNLADGQAYRRQHPSLIRHSNPHVQPSIYNDASNLIQLRRQQFSEKQTQETPRKNISPGWQTMGTKNNHAKSKFPGVAGIATTSKQKPAASVLQSILGDPKTIIRPPSISNKLKPNDSRGLLANAFGRALWKQRSNENRSITQQTPSRRYARKWGRTSVTSTRQRRPILEKPKFEFQYKLSNNTQKRTEKKFSLNKNRRRPSNLQKFLGIKSTPNYRKTQIEQKVEKPKLEVYNKKEFSNRFPISSPTTVSIYDRMEQKILQEQKRKLKQKQIKLDKEKRMKQNERQELETLRIDKSQQQKLEEQMKAELKKKRLQNIEMKTSEHPKTIAEGSKITIESRKQTPLNQGLDNNNYKNTYEKKISQSISEQVGSPSSRNTMNNNLLNQLDNQWRQFISLLLRQTT